MKYLSLVLLIVFVSFSCSKFDISQYPQKWVLVEMSGTQTERFSLRSANKLTGTWSACDGPGLEYKRVE